MRAVTALRHVRRRCWRAPRAAVGPGGAAQLSQELFALIGGALLAAEIGVSLGGGEFVVQLSQASPVREECGTVNNRVGGP